MSESYYLMPLMMGTVCHYYYGSSGSNHWVSFIPLCNMGQFVTMSNEKIPVSRPKYLQIIRCLTLYWLLWTIAQKWTAPDAGAAFWHSHIPNKTKIFYMNKGENKIFFRFHTQCRIEKDYEGELDLAPPPCTYLTLRVMRTDIKMPGIPPSTKQ